MKAAESATIDEFGNLKKVGKENAWGYFDEKWKWHGNVKAHKNVNGDLFPESQIVAEAYDLGPNSPRIQSVYDEMEREIAQLEERTADYSQHVFAALIKARREVELLKVPTFVDMIEELFDEGKSVVLFTNFDDTVQSVFGRLSKKLKSLVGFITGDRAKQREHDIAEFDKDNYRIIIANISAGGVGVNLHDLNGKYPRASIISPTWSAFNMRQALGRVWRQGGLTKSYQRIVYASGCIEEDICRRVQFRLNCLDTLNDGLNDEDLLETNIYKNETHN
jgi:superfamily II DNA or RNA helicase